MSDHPPGAEALFHEGTRLLGAGDLTRAEWALREALRLAPELAEAHANLGYLHEQAKRWTEAGMFYAKALELAPWDTRIHLNLGNLLVKLKRFDDGERLYRDALKIAPDSAALWSNLGVLLASAKREPEAEQCYRTALSIDPHYRKATFNLSYILLRQGRYAEGWACMEARDWYARLEQHLKLPRWHGEALEGKSILIGAEAGHGDMIQFCRYTPLLKARGAHRVSLLCHPALKPLLTSLAEVDAIIALDEALPDTDWDYWLPALSLPLLLQTTLRGIPAKLPYLHPPAERLSRWAKLIGPRDGKQRIGLAWKGNPRFENDADRSLGSLALLAPLADLPDVRFFSLQKGSGEDEAAQAQPPLPITDLAPGIADFADTAAIIAHLDLVITVDTAIAHLAGALAKPCWVLLPDYQTDWRWLAERDDSPWYPGVMRLFRQTIPGDWPTVIAEVRKALLTEHQRPEPTENPP